MAQAAQLQHRRGTAGQIGNFTGAQGELVVDTTNNRVVVSDGTTVGGWPAAKLVELAEYLITLQNVNFNSANTDNAILLYMPAWATRVKFLDVTISGATASITTATFGLFTATGGGGVAIVASASVTVSTAAANTNNNLQTMTLANAGAISYTPGGFSPVNTIQARIGTAEGSAATANVSVRYQPLP